MTEESQRNGVRVERNLYSESFTVKEIEMMKNCLGLNYSPKKSYRNYYSGQSDSFDSFVERGLATVNVSEKSKTYYLSPEGIEVLRIILGDFKVE